MKGLLNNTKAVDILENLIGTEKNRIHQIYNLGYKEGYKDAVTERRKGEPMSDLISREDVKRMIIGKHLCVLDERILINALEDIPSAEPKVGHWIMHIDDLFPADSTQECSICHEHQYLMNDDKYCPNCGAKMERSE